MKPLLWLTILCVLVACQQTAPSTARTPPSSHLVETIVIRPQPLNQTIVYTGTLRAHHLARIFTQESGKITLLPYYEGDIITKGAILIRLEDSLLQAELNKAAAVYQQTAANLQRLQKLVKTNAIAKNELDQVETDTAVAQAEVNILQTRLSYTKIYAPFNGILTERLIEPEDVISAQTHVLTMIDPDSIVVDITPSEKIISQLAIKQIVSIQIDALGQQQFPGTVTRIYPTIDPQTRLGTVEIRFDQLPKGAKVGQFGRVAVAFTTTPQLSVPYIALRRDNQGEYVFLLDSDSKVHRQTVQTGLRLADRIEILDGLNEGQTIVTKGFLGLNPEMTVHPIHPENIIH